ncbi:MAG TPA: hypothetical protein VGK00_02335 [Anaerolineales bacterium]|jgi:hypothetical protein
MRNQNGQNEQNENKPDRLAIVASIAGLALLCPATAWILLLWIYGVLLNQVVIVLSILFIVGTPLIYGSVQLTRGNEATKRVAKNAIKNFGLGAASACLLGMLLVLVNPVTAYSAFGAIWTTENFLLGVLPRVLITGIPAGGIGGALLGNFWKHRRAAIAGGMTAELLIIPILFRLFPPVT